MTRILTTRRLAAVGAATAVFAVAVGAFAYLTASGSGSGNGAVGTLGAPANVGATAAPGSHTVQITWDGVSAPDGGSVEYYVTRNDGATTSASCGSSPGSRLPAAPTSCDDTGVVDGTYTYEVVAVWRSWTSTSSSSNSVTVVTPPEVVSISIADASPTNASEVHWTVTFDGNVNYVDATDFILVGSGSTGGALITNVTGGSDTYTVTADTGGDGVLGLDLVDDDTIEDATGNKLGGTGTSGAGDGSFTGATYTIDKTAPTVTVNQKAGQADPTNALPILWTVTFSEPVTGFDASDLTRGGTTTGGTVAVTGSGASYEISLSGSPTNGTTSFTIAANTAQDLAGNNNTASTSTDNTVTSDTVAPPAPSVSSSSPQNNRVTLTFTDTEAGVTFECQFEATGWVACSSPFTFGPGSQYDGLHNYSVRAVDGAGNRSAATTVQQSA